MDPETLVTFLFRAPPEARTVELLGSWDNFSHPYRMHADRRRGQGAWSGCFKFLDIIFDGDGSSFHKPRTGGLKQGGTYWYFYRLDDALEAYDDARETTTACPLLPGQSMNVIEVPMELADPPVRSRSASVDAVPTLATLPTAHTLEPQDKFAALAPPPPSKVHARCVSEVALTVAVDKTVEPTDWSEVPRPRERNPHFSSDPHLAANELPQRYYATAHIADDRSSMYSRESWSSAACSSTQSFVVDAYDIEPSPFADDELPYFPQVDIPPVPSRAPPAIPSSISDTLDSQVDQDPEEAEGISPSSSPPMPSRPPPAIPIEAQQPHQLEPSDELAADTPPSSTPGENDRVQPPPTSFRPDLRLELHKLSQPSSSFQTNHTTSPSKSPTDIRSTELEYLRRTSSDQTHTDEDDDDDILSPTFSAATVSSRGGLNTPFRISIGQLCHTAGFSSDEEMDKVTERLRSLGHDGEVVLSNPAAVGFPSPIAEVDEATFPSFPCLSNLSADSKMDTLVERSMSPQPSVMDAIFSELGHLGPSIA